jgi:hypothetical protein
LGREVKKEKQQDEFSVVSFHLLFISQKGTSQERVVVVVGL